jgi:HD-GYP domain-containing protein (c-di-GMP phosphodiesterase class II)
MSTQEILDELNDHSGTQFDPRIVKAFTQVIRSGSESVIVNSARTAIGDEKSSASGGDPRGSYPELRQVEG